MPHVDRVIVIDDGSTDTTLEQLADLDILAIRQPANLGKAASLQRGFHEAQESGADWVVTLDGDGQHDPN
ncbi:MAG: glycosyltransferase, partial [Candidatus Thiodiazotropha sp.]